MEKKERPERVISDATLDRYLGAILALSEARSPVRSVDVAQRLGCSRACVSMALKQMTGQALVRVERQGALSLSAEGLRRARAHRERCFFIQDLLTQSGVEAEAARIEADAVTRAMSGGACDALRSYLSGQGISVQPAAEL